VRVEHAKQLIEEHDTSISEVAAGVGYHNRRTFERAFKKWTGTTPTKFKAIVKPC
jgi:YesN/AraC family two-component response regulator